MCTAWAKVCGPGRGATTFGRGAKGSVLQLGLAEATEEGEVVWNGGTVRSSLTSVDPSLDVQPILMAPLMTKTHRRRPISTRRPVTNGPGAAASVRATSETAAAKFSIEAWLSAGTWALLPRRRVRACLGTMADSKAPCQSEERVNVVLDDCVGGKGGRTLMLESIELMQVRAI